MARSDTSIAPSRPRSFGCDMSTAAACETGGAESDAEDMGSPPCFIFEKSLLSDDDFAAPEPDEASEFEPPSSLCASSKAALSAACASRAACFSRSAISFRMELSTAAATAKDQQSPHGLCSFTGVTYPAFVR